ncbi:MAG: hypothetical protein HY332_20340 [Chloroflexi bacterium]|nr:hypothetical protein [Chloroflexota bacterium]
MQVSYHLSVTTRTIEKITVVVTVAVLGVALAAGLRGGPAALLVAALVVTVSAGVDLVLRGESRYRPTPDLFILPAALVVGAALFLPLLTSGATLVVGLALFGALLFAVLWTEHGGRVGLIAPRTAGTALAAIGYIAAFVLYAAIYQSKARSLISAPAIVLITLLLTARQLRLAQLFGPTALDQPPAPGQPTLPVKSAPPAHVAQSAPHEQPATSLPSAAAESSRHLRLREGAAWRRTLVYAAVAALAAGEITWALNYWPINGLLGGAFLLAAFYFLTGIFTQQLLQRLSARVVAEYGTVAVAAVLLIAVAGLVRRGA